MPTSTLHAMRMPMTVEQQVEGHEKTDAQEQFANEHFKEHLAAGKKSVSHATPSMVLSEFARYRAVFTLGKICASCSLQI